MSKRKQNSRSAADTAAFRAAADAAAAAAAFRDADADAEPPTWALEIARQWGAKGEPTP